MSVESAMLSRRRCLGGVPTHVANWQQYSSVPDKGYADVLNAIGMCTLRERRNINHTSLQYWLLGSANQFDNTRVSS